MYFMHSSRYACIFVKYIGMLVHVKELSTLGRHHICVCIYIIYVYVLVYLYNICVYAYLYGMHLPIDT